MQWAPTLATEPTAAPPWQATLCYVTYEFAPVAPYPTAQVQVLSVYQALRSHSRASQLGFRASPLVLAGLSAGGNRATWQ